MPNLWAVWWNKSILGLLSLWLISGCNNPEIQVDPAFYHWQTNFEPSSFETDFLDSLAVGKLYLKFFDVDWDFQEQGAFPQARIQWGAIPDTHRFIVPTVFITNRTLLQITDDKLDTLANNIYSQIQKLSAPLAEAQVVEIQIDCDWTLKTKDKYFKLLRSIKAQMPEALVLSATIRLHQIKFADKTGVPPVDRGMLMFYNMGDLEDWNTDNSILDLEIGQQYFYNFQSYPLPLDVALPLFSWGVLFRQGRMIKLLNQLEASELQDENRFKRIAAERYEVVESGYLRGHYLYTGDWIRLETVPFANLKESAAILRKVLKKNDLSISFYHLDTMVIKNYSYEQLESVLHIFEGSNGSK